ncbi:hypothetical protein cpu_24950 [Carboxydothermus pertinax]|uniref:Uncharacterized protein n=1 Tax=Carboxydothermus pertinax TaxID=870242 RepID=A0A1L8CYI6_9THEO|nr:hypothetical protein cpu_24950 [Carboxydothermus pertinax]
MANFAVTAVAGSFIGMTGIAFCRIFSVFTAMNCKKSRIMGFDIIMAGTTFSFAVTGIASTASFG